MIVSHKHRFIFIKTQKTAGTSLEIALSAICGPDDIITAISPDDEGQRQKLTGKGPQNDQIPFTKYSLKDWGRLLLKRKKARYYNHMPARVLKKLLRQEIWDSYFKFCFVRNPWDRMVSFYSWKKELEGSETFEDFVHGPEARRLKGLSMYTENGRLLVDKIYRYEQLGESLDDIASRLKITELILPTYKAKETDRPAYKTFYNSSSREAVAKQFAGEIELFPYGFEPSTNMKES